MSDRIAAPLACSFSYGWVLSRMMTFDKVNMMIIANFTLVGVPYAIYEQVQYSSILMTNAEKMFLTRKAGYPIERTLLTSGVVEAACQSLTYKKRISTPHMASLTYMAPAQSLFGGHQEFYHARREDHAD